MHVLHVDAAIDRAPMIEYHLMPNNVPGFFLVVSFFMSNVIVSSLN